MLALLDPRVWLVLVIAVGIAGGLGEVHGRYKQHQADDAFHQAYVEKQRAMVTGIALDQAHNLMKVQQLEADLEAKHLATTQSVQKMVVAIPAHDAHVRVPDSAVRVLDYAIATANDSRPGPETTVPVAETPAAPEAVKGSVDIGGLTAWGTTAAAMYSACLDRVDLLIGAYDSVRKPTLVPHG